MLLLSLVALTGLVYANAVNHPFVYDDRQLILENPDIRSVSNIPKIMGFTEDGFKLEDRWTREVTHAVEYAAVGLWAPLYHFTNIVLHAAVGLLVFLLVSRVFGDRLIGWWTAALWVAHPIQTEVAAQVSGRRDLLSAVFALWFLIVMERYLRNGGGWRLPVAFALLLLGVFSKQVVLMAPGAVFLIDLYLPRDGDDRPVGLLGRTRDALLRHKGMYAALIAVTLGLAAVVLWGTSSAVGLDGSPSVYASDPVGELGFAARMFTAGLALRMVLAPVGQACSYGYDALEIASRGVLTPLGIVNFALFGLGVAATSVGLWRRHWIGFAGAWFALFFFPTSGFLIAWHEPFAERWMYLPSMGFALCLAFVLVSMYRSPRFRQMAPVAGVMILVTLGAATHLRNRVWGSSEGLWQNAVERYPRTSKSHKAVASLYLLQNRTALALEHYQKALELTPSYYDAHIGVIASLTGMGKYGNALEEADRAIERWPDRSRGYGLKGTILQTLGRFDEAETAFRKSLELAPDRGNGYSDMAMLYMQQGDFDAAIEWYEKAVAEDPSLGLAFLNLESLYRHHAGNAEKADYYGRLAKDVMRDQ